jgi:hypothetical protein
MSRLTFLAIFTTILISTACNKPNKFEEFIEVELDQNKTQRRNQQFYIIDMTSCSGCLEINNSYLSQLKSMNLNLVYIGDMERGGFFNRSLSSPQSIGQVFAYS